MTVAAGFSPRELKPAATTARAGSSPRLQRLLLSVRFQPHEQVGVWDGRTWGRSDSRRDEGDGHEAQVLRAAAVPAVAAGRSGAAATPGNTRGTQGFGGSPPRLGERRGTDDRGHPGQDPKAATLFEIEQSLRQRRLPTLHCSRRL